MQECILPKVETVFKKKTFREIPVPWCKRISMQLFKDAGPIVKKERGLANQNHLTGNLFLHSSNAANFNGCNGQFGFSPHII